MKSTLSFCTVLIASVRPCKNALVIAGSYTHSIRPYNPNQAPRIPIWTKASGLIPWFVTKFFPYFLNSSAWQSFWQIRSEILVSANRMPVRREGERAHSSFLGVVSIRSTRLLGAKKDWAFRKWGREETYVALHGVVYTLVHEEIGVLWIMLVQMG